MCLLRCRGATLGVPPPAPRGEHGDAALVQVAAQAVPGEGPRALEAVGVVRVGVGDVNLAIHRIDGHRVQDGADALEEAARSGKLARRIGHGVEHEHVLVGQREPHVLIAGAAERVDPVSAVPLDDGPDLGRGAPFGVGGRSRDAVRTEAVRDRGLGDGGGPVAGVEAGGVDAGAVGRHREGARSVREEGDDRERRTAEGAAERVRVEHPDVRASHARGRELGIEREVLAAMGRRDERPLPPRSGEDDVARLVAHEERALDLARQIAIVLVELDDAHAVREMVDHPDLVIRPGRDGDRLEAHRDGGGVDEPMLLDAEDLEAVVRRVDGEQVPLVRRHGERPHLPALEQRVRGRGLGRAAAPASELPTLRGRTSRAPR